MGALKKSDHGNPQPAAPAQVWLRFSDGAEYAHAGKLQFSEVPPAAGTGSVSVRAMFPNPEGELLPGMSVRVQVQDGVRNQALLVPQRSVIRDTTGQARVLVVGSNNRVEIRSVTIERMVGDQWLIGVVWASAQVVRLGREPTIDIDDGAGHVRSRRAGKEKYASSNLSNARGALNRSAGKTSTHPGFHVGRDSYARIDEAGLDDVDGDIPIGEIVGDAL
jgi:hypothetical protein